MKVSRWESEKVSQGFVGASVAAIIGVEASGLPPLFCSGQALSLPKGLP
jgi:hypothetical protein